MNNKNSTIARVVALVVILIIGVGALAYTFLMKKSATQAPAPTTSSPSDTQSQMPAIPSGQSPTQTESAQPQASAAETSTYKNGTYAATGSYISPGGDETIGVSLTLASDIVTAVTVTPHPVNSEDGTFQRMFAANISPLVVGKNIADVHVNQVSGSSLTSGGFNQAIASIETQAKA